MKVTLKEFNISTVVRFQPNLMITYLHIRKALKILSMVETTSCINKIKNRSKEIFLKT